jgi:hypothetical protein
VFMLKWRKHLNISAYTYIYIYIYMAFSCW